MSAASPPRPSPGARPSASCSSHSTNMRCFTACACCSTFPSPVNRPVPPATAHKDDVMAFTVVLVDDHQVLRDAIKEILARNPDFQVVGEAGSGPEAVDVCKRLDPDLTVMDI